MSKESPVTGYDGELIERLNDIEEVVTDLGSLQKDLAQARKEREETMLQVMKTLEGQKVKGVPSLYTTIGRGRNRLVVCNVPHFVQGQGANESQWVPNYLVFSRKGFFSVCPTAFHFDKGDMHDMQNPLTFRAAAQHWGGEIGLFLNAVVLNSNRDRDGDGFLEVDVKFSTENMPQRIIISYNNRFGRRRSDSESSVYWLRLLSGEEARDHFVEVQNVLQDFYGKAIGMNVGTTEFARGLRQESDLKRKNG